MPSTPDRCPQALDVQGDVVASATSRSRTVTAAAENSSTRLARRPCPRSPPTEDEVVEFEAASLHVPGLGGESTGALVLGDLEIADVTDEGGPTGGPPLERRLGAPAAWKIQTRTPNVAASDNMSIAMAFSGSTTEPSVQSVDVDRRLTRQIRLGRPAVLAVRHKCPTLTWALRRPRTAAACPMLVMRGRPDPNNPVLLAVDGSPAGENAAESAFTEATSEPPGACVRRVATADRIEGRWRELIQVPEAIFDRREGCHQVG